MPVTYFDTSIEVAGEEIATQVAGSTFRSQVNICVASSIFVCLSLFFFSSVAYATKMGQGIQGKSLLAAVNTLIHSLIHS